MINEEAGSHNDSYSENWSNVDAICFQARVKEISSALNKLKIPENAQRTASILIVGPGIGADGVAIRSQFPSAHLLLLDVDSRAEAAAQYRQLKNFSFVQGDLVANARVLEELLKPDLVDMCFALRSSSGIVLNLLSYFEKQAKKCTLVFTLLVNTEPPQLFAAVKNSVKQLHGKSHYLVEGRSFTEQGFVVYIGGEHNPQS